MSAPAARFVEEVAVGGALPLWRHPEWEHHFPWLVQGTTGAGEGDEPFDLGLFGEQPVGRVMDRWRALGDATGALVVVHSRQVHGVELCEHEALPAPGVLLTQGFDGHLTDRSGVLLTVSVADCVPVFLVDEERRVVAAVHAGWRGVAGGIVERAAARMAERYGTGARSLWVHFGPSICGECYEVGPEVHAAVDPAAPAPSGPRAIDLRAALAGRARALGVAEDRITASAHCTRCGPGRFFSHRGGSAARQMGYLGIR